MFEPVVDGTETGAAGWFTKEEIAALPLHPALEKNLENIFGEFDKADDPELQLHLADSAADDDEVDIIDATGWEKVGGQGGSNLGGMYESPGGNRYYVKKGKTEDHARNEALAAQLYEAAGVTTAQQLLAETPFGGLGTASPEIPNKKQDLQAHLGDEVYLDQIRDGFAVDAWLANWDVAGLVYDNVVSDENGAPVRVDPGGALYFRAQGSPKGGLFGDSVGELDSLRDPGMSPQGSKIFGGMTDDEIRASAMHVMNVSPEQIDEIVDSVGFGDGVIDPEEMKARLKARRKDLADKLGLTLPEEEGPNEPAPAVDTSPEPEEAPGTITVPYNTPTLNHVDEVSPGDRVWELHNGDGDTWQATPATVVGGGR